jgi:hypothetical protein
MDNKAELLMLSGVVALCADCGDERIFVPADGGEATPGEFCCTSCDAAVFLMTIASTTARRTAAA